ncbi:hypothetical protein M0812_04417 [Anaeramoeba flamelloides]|uniref:Uncharacterized protein n=1 Tax=Anaeramoeba flamelloides TaxID=1746091 RepID=A0AAV8AJP4_9EUKA|nr:hypothetical protein M0812_04417 [Anaeramoeba flamelloides]
MDGNLIITNDDADDYDDDGVPLAVIFLNGNIKTNNKRKTKKRHLNMRHENRMDLELILHKMKHKKIEKEICILKKSLSENTDQTFTESK